MVTGRPAISSNSPSKSSRCIGRSRLSARPAVLGRRGEDHRLHRGLAVRGHEHVLGPAQADALGAELARAPRRPRACRRWRARRAGGCRPPSASTVLEVLARPPARPAARRRPDTRPVEPSMAMQVALAQHGVADAQLAAPRGRRAVAEAPATQGLPIPRATSAACAGLPALGGEDALRGEEPVHVVGLGERPREDHATAALRPLDRVLGGEHDLPLGGSGRRRDAGRQHVELDVGREARVQERVQPSRRRSVRSASARDSRPSSTASTAKRTAACAGRLATRVCSRKRRPSSTVNSTSCMSR